MQYIKWLVVSKAGKVLQLDIKSYSENSQYLGRVQYAHF